LTEPVTAAVRKRLQQDGTLRVVRNPDADIVLTGTIIDYVRRGLSFSPEDVRTPRDYEIRITAHVTAYRQTNGKQLIEQKVTARAAVRVVGDQASAERELLPILADDLARQICSLVVDGSW
ncbi:MAG: LPS assembly lipoprotein LptE, partial [candidate division WOR-3 bacterium]